MLHLRHQDVPLNFRQLAYGVLSFLPGLSAIGSRGTGGSGSALYCYAVWLRHLKLAHDHGMRAVPRVVAELGPGDSIGVGLAALLSGASRYVALDAVTHADVKGNLAVFDELVELFRARAPIPGRDAFPEQPVFFDDHAFPGSVLRQEDLRHALMPDRIQRLRRIVAGEEIDRNLIDYRAPAGALEPGDAGTVDLLVTNAVLEHVVDLPDCYHAMHAWLAPDGLISNMIDFRSHGLFRAWDGHWSCPDWLWRLFVGRRPYLLNREPLTTHRRLSRKAGLDERALQFVTCEPSRKTLSPRFSDLSEIDCGTCGAYLLLQRAHKSS